MKFVIIALAVIATTEVQAFKCVVGTDGTAGATTCPANTDKCSGPKWTEYVGYATGVEWKCGACPDNTPTCETCAKDDENGCNKKKTITAYTCLDYEVKTANSKTSIKKKGTDASCQRSAAVQSTCNKPTLTATQTKYTSASGCGACVGSEQTGKTCEQCDGASCNTLAAKKCVQGDGKAAAADCAELTATKCFQPVFTEYTGFAKDVNYGCGECATGTTATCKTCTAAATGEGCNKAEAVGADFKCYSYTFDTTAKAFKKATAETTCSRKSGTAIACNQPEAGATATTYTSTSGCGTCKPAEKKAKGCKECAKDKCNSATSVTALLLPLLAMIYTLY